jgi:hypothetical protein
MAAVFRDDEFRSRNCIDPFLVKLQTDRDPFHLRFLNFVQLFGRKRVLGPRKHDVNEKHRNVRRNETFADLSNGLLQAI